MKDISLKRNERKSMLLDCYLIRKEKEKKKKKNKKTFKISSKITQDIKN